LVFDEHETEADDNNAHHLLRRGGKHAARNFIHVQSTSTSSKGTFSTEKKVEV